MPIARARTALDSSNDTRTGSRGIQRTFLHEPCFDLLVDDCLLAELKAVEILHTFSKAQLFSYMKLLNVPVGLLINFHEPILKNGISRMILRGANRTEEDESNEISF